MADAASRIRDLAAPVIAGRGLELLDVQVRGTGGSQLLRVVVDRKGGVPLSALQEVSGRLSEELDRADPLEGRYALEVTSPGTDAPLRDRRDFDRVEGRPVLVQHDAGDGRVLQTRGTVVAAGDDDVQLDVDGDRVRIAYASVVMASQALPW